jgi:hypothetical protein
MRADDVIKKSNVEIEVLSTNGLTRKVSPVAYAKEVGHGITIDMGDGSTITFFANGKTKVEYTELPEGHEPIKEPF